MKNYFQKFSIAFVIAFSFAKTAYADCSDVLRVVGANYSQQFTTRDLKSFAYEELCKSNSSNQSLDVFAFYDDIGLDIGTSRASADKFCSENANFTSNQVTAERVSRTVYGPAVKAWESCNRAKSKGLEVNTSVSNNGELVSFLLTNRSTSDALFLGAAISPSESVSCNYVDERGNNSDVTLTTRANIARGGIGTMDCFVSRNSDGSIPGFALNIRSSIESFQISLPEIPAFDDTPQEVIPQKTTINLTGRPWQSQAYWTNKQNGTGWIQCPRSIYGIPDDFDIIVLSTRKEEWGRGHRDLSCGHRPEFCDGDEEHCADIYIVKGCAINRDYHDYYKARMDELGFAYSGDPLCQ
ncbi:hypothetical protein [Pseudaestuariivita rosea]|uniref:hypothetical protein n=1 Tax=Pseudaestuariivita rosea TaxID=2763263 RepID=UPI001ABA6710|nr:hypothetical protein [Pseudaestuariivita rosea]